VNSFLKHTALFLAAGFGLAGSVDAAEVFVTGDIATSTTWTSNNTYNLQNQIYVLPGATLTIQPGTLVASDTGLGGSLAITKGAKLIAQGNKNSPIIFTSKADVATWTGGDPRTGTWRESANEWGNITIMGNGFISENATVGNTASCSASNVAAMEGLVSAFPGDTKVLYGGGNDDDDSGSLSYVSLRYGGRVIGLNNELNGLSLGGIGRETDIDHVEIMNNVDDGIEIWGGTVNLKNISVWNIGDDSVDIDQGYRGKMQYVLIVQGYSANAAQGSGVGDNCFETDGAEDSDWQPVTTTVIYNATVVGQLFDGDGGTTWRDNARVQYRNCVFTDLGEQLVLFDNLDGDGANGYGHNGTLSWASTWTTPYNSVPVHTNDCPPGTYNGQTSGMLASITDSVFYNNLAANAYTEATTVGVLNPANNNVVEPASSPIVSVTRAAPLVKGGKLMAQVIGLDPRPANDALVAADFCDGDDFIEPVKFRGAFAPGDDWLDGWTASQAYGFTPASDPWSHEGCNFAGVCGFPILSTSGDLTSGSTNQTDLLLAAPNALTALFLAVGPGTTPAPFKGGTIKPVPFLPLIFIPTDAAGEIHVPYAWPAGIPAGIELWQQFGIQDAAANNGVSLSNAVVGVTP
jgi:hypothetical protein